MIAWVWKLATSPIAWAVAAVLVGFLYGQHVGATRCEARVAEAVADIQARHADAIARALEDANKRIAAAEAEVSALEQEVTAYEEEIAGRPDVCLLGDDDARRLRHIQ